MMPGSLNVLLAFGLIAALASFVAVTIIIVVRVSGDWTQTSLMAEGCTGSTEFDLAFFQVGFSIAGTVLALLVFPFIIYQWWGSPAACFLGATLVFALAETVWSFDNLGKIR